MSARCRDQQVFPEALGTLPFRVAAVDITQCQRDRLYWRGPYEAFSGLERHCGKTITIPGGPGLVSRWIRSGSIWTEAQLKSRRLPTLVRRVPKRAPPRLPIGWDRCDADALEKYAQDQFAYPPNHYLRSNCLRRPGNVYETPDAEERELIVDFPLRHTIILGPTSWRKESKTKLEIQRCELIGNLFQCGVLPWLLGHLGRRQAHASWRAHSRPDALASAGTHAGSCSTGC